MSTVRKSEKIRFGLLQATYWCSIGAFGAFAVALARARGISATTIGIMAAIYRISAVLGQVFWGAMCDKLRSNRSVFILMNAVMFVVSYGFYLFKSMPMMVLFYALMGFMNSPTSSNLDTWIISTLRRGNDDSYGPIRSCGSLGYAVFIFFYGSLIASEGYWVMPLFMLGFVLLTVAVSFSMPSDKRGEVKGTAAAANKITAADFRELFRNSTYLFVLAILFFDGFAIMSINQMKVLIWEDMGVSIAYQGYDGFVSGMAQIPMMILASRLSMLRPSQRLGIGVLLDMCMIVLDYFAKVPGMVLAGSVMAGMGYGLILPAMREIIIRNTGEKLRTTAQGIGDAAYLSISSVLGSVSSGILIDNFGMKSMMLFSLFVQIIPIAISIVFIRRMKHSGTANA